MGKYIAIAIFVLVFIAFIMIVRFFFSQIYKRRTSTTVKFMKSLVTIVLSTILVFIVLSQFNATKDASTTLLQSGSLIIAMATFAAQKVLGNIVSGLVISWTKPFEIGQKIMVMSGGQKVIEGIVMDINLRHTTIKGLDDKCSLVPNGVLDEMVIVNNDTIANSGYYLEMECAFDADVDKAIEIMAEQINSNPLTLNKDMPQSSVLCSGLSPNGFMLKSIVWTKTLSDNFLAMSQLRVSIFKAWREAGIEIPYQTITIDKK